MQIPIKPYYTISGIVLLQQYGGNNPVIDESVRLNILLDIPHARLPVLFAFLGRIKNNYLFSLPASLVSDQDMLKALLPACYTLASLDNFSSTGGMIIPIHLDNAVQQADTNTDPVTNYFYDQGTANLHLPFFGDPRTAIQQAASCSFYVYDITVSNAAVEPAIPDITIIAFATEINNLAAFNDCISRIKADWDMKDLSENYVEKKVFEEEMQHWQKRALLYRNFLSLSKSVQEKEYYEVVDWYHKEYEALPLWYKRFGHIIKVIMGKRNFRSLFNDNIKKYKD